MEVGSEDSISRASKVAFRNSAIKPAIDVSGSSVVM
jgi:hypothetical protein